MSRRDEWVQEVLKLQIKALSEYPMEQNRFVCVSMCVYVVSRCLGRHNGPWDSRILEILSLSSHHSFMWEVRQWHLFIESKNWLQRRDGGDWDKSGFQVNLHSWTKLIYIIMEVH